MELGPREIHEMEFHDAWRGYNQVEVDDFLDRVAEVLDRSQRENRQLHDRVRALEEQVARAKDSEEMLKNTLVGAQRAAEEAIQTARAKAESLIAQAEARARSRSEDVARRSEQAERDHLARKRELEASLARLRHLEGDLRSKLQTFLEDHLRALEHLQPASQAPPARPPGASHLRAQPSRKLVEGSG